ncbi:MAG: alpha-galactosidase [Oscillospiraceae bacterium]|nr:alpha-galactosidase [Oscillospiraceae bacterium]
MGGGYVGTFASGEGIEARRYVSGRQVLDEGLIGGRLICRYRGCAGQVVPEMHLGAGHLGWVADHLGEAQAFVLGIDGSDVSGGWEFAGYREEEADGGARLCLMDLTEPARGVGVTVRTRLYGGDFIARSLEVRNTSGSPKAITSIAPYAGHVWSHRFAKGRSPNCSKAEFIDGPSFGMAHNHSSGWGREGDFHFDGLTPGEKSISCAHGKSGWSRPACWLRDYLTGETLVVEFAWSGNWRIKAYYSDDGFEHLSMSVGMPDLEGEALRVLGPGEGCVTPEVHFALFREGDDSIVQATHRHVRERVIPPLPAGVPVAEIEANHRGYLCDRETEEGIKRDVDVAKAVGAEMYVIDAGWFGSGERNNWGNNVGDWVSGHWLPGGVEAISEYAHGLGMRFGLWMEIEAAGHWSELRERHPEWLARRNGSPCAGGRALDLSMPEVEAFCLETIGDAIGRYGLDMYRIDHNHNVGLGATRIRCGYLENTQWLYYEAFYRVFDALRARHPKVVLQNCAGGGGRLDWGTLSRFHNTELSDWMRQPRDVRILAGVTMSLPPEILLRTLGTESGETHTDSDLDSQFRKCVICRPIYRGIAPSVAELTPYLRGKCEGYNRLYRELMRPLLGSCLVFHHTPFQPVQSPCERTVLEYAAPDGSLSVLAVFTSSPGDHLGYVAFPRGTVRSADYEVEFLGSGDVCRVTGWELANHGIKVPVGFSMSSEMVVLKAV